MDRRRLAPCLALTLLLAAARCDRPADSSSDRPLLLDPPESLLSITRGATLVHRTGEYDLQVSPLLAIDSDPRTWWATPMEDPDQSATFALAGIAEVRRIGFSTGTFEGYRAPRSIAFESSLDGSSFSPLGRVRLDDYGEAWLEVPPTPTLYVRVTTDEGFHPEARQILVPTLFVEGSEPAAAPRPDASGGWRINGFHAVFDAGESIVRGVVLEDPPRSLEGGWDGRLIRFAWAREAERGVGAATLDSEGKALGALMWYLRPDPPFFGASWTGSRASSGSRPQGGPDPMEVFLRMDGRYPLYGLEFEGTKLREGSAPAVRRLAEALRARRPGRCRLVAHHVGSDSAEADRRIAAERLESLRAALIAAGADLAGTELVASGRAEAVSAPDRPWTPLQVRLNNRIDLVVTEPDGGGPPR
ncbi:MAG TPA: discoidin domain-containing protein [Thermoanaerobaculia bacterium]|nr:discoidin domain-containing protein [Thermoanaerobaculia bacterium]